MDIGCSFSYLNKKQALFSQEFRFDVLPMKSSRMTWVHVSEDLPTYSQTEIQ